MSNANTAADLIYMQNQGQPIVLPFSATGHAAFALGGQPAVLTVPNPMASIVGGDSFPARAATNLPLIIRAAGTSTLGGNVAYQIDINQGTGLSPAIVTTGVVRSGIGAGLQKDNWLLECLCLWDSSSTNLRGIVYGWAGASSISQAALVGSAPAALANLQFTCAVSVLNVNASNSFSLSEFSVEFV